MEIGLIIRFGKPVAGREEKAVELFTEATEYMAFLKDKGSITYFEPFVFWTTDREEETGFFLIKAPVTEIFKLLEEERFLWLQEKALYLVDHFRYDLLTVGEYVPTYMERGAKVRAELGIAH